MVYLTQWTSSVDLIRLLALSLTLHETDLMNMDKAGANVEVAVPERPKRFQEPRAAVNDQPVRADRPR